MTAFQRIIALLREPDYSPMTADELATALRIKPRARPAFDREIQTLLRQGTIVRMKQDRYCLPTDADLVTGTIIFRQSGKAFVHPDSGDPNSPPVEIRAENTGTAFHKDKVVVRLSSKQRPFVRNWKKQKQQPVAEPERLYGKVIRVIERARTSLTGTLRRSRNYFFVVPDDPRIVHDIIVPDPAQTPGVGPVKIDSKVVVRLHEWKHTEPSPEGEVVQVLGESFTPQVEHQALLYQFSLANDFPPEVLAEVSSVKPYVSAEQIQGRADCRKLFTFTIDPQDAKDFDDALSLERLPDGNMRIGIHIADVTAYVRPASALDREAYERGNSTYLIGQVIPMLPHALSNGICSLVEGEDRLTKAVFVTYDPKGRLVETRFANTVINSRKRMTYEQVFAIMKTEDLDAIRALPVPPAHQTGSTGRALATLGDDELREIKAAVGDLWGIGAKLRERRMAQGALDLELSEVRIYCDPQGYPDRIVRESGDPSHWLIEEFMLVANEAVARAFNEAGIPAIHRVHTEPNPERLNEFADWLEPFGLIPGDLTKRRNAIQLLNQIKEHPQTQILRTAFLRSLSKACYKAEPLGHYGLNKLNYLHFTSPIRRYADLVCHRIFDHYLNRRGLATAPAEPGPGYLPVRLTKIAQHISLTELNSTEAERESKKNKILEFFERETQRTPRNEFGAIITEVRSHGMFIELEESMAFGMIPLSSMDDLYVLSDDNTRLTGRRRKRVFALGQRVSVIAFRVDRFKKQIDFLLAPSEFSARNGVRKLKG